MSTGKMIGIGVIFILAFIVFTVVNPLVFISAGERGVVLRMGAVTDRVLGEGPNWVTPVTDTVYKMDVTLQKVEKKDIMASSKDLQTVVSSVAINYKLDPDKVNHLYQKIKYDYDTRIIDPAIEEFVKKTTAEYTAEELITKREAVKDALLKSLRTALSNNYIIVEDIFITDFRFSNEFAKAIEAKVTAEQEALQSKNLLQKVKYEAEQRVAEAEGEAKAIAIQAKAITSQGGKEYVELKKIEAWLAGGSKVPTTLITGKDGGSFLVNIP